MKKYFFFLFILPINLMAQTGWISLNAGITQNEHGKICLTNQNNVFVITDHGYFHKSADGGSTWQTINVGIDEIFNDIDFLDNNFGVIVGENGSLLTTNDGGVNWITINVGTTVNLHAVDIVNLNTIYCVGDQGTIIYTNNGGVSWTVNSGLTSNDLFDVAFKNDLVGYIVGYLKILKTVDGGTTWTEPVTDYSSLYYNNYFSLSITDTKVRFIHGSGYRSGWGVSYSTDEGSSWQAETEYELPMCASTLMSSINFLNDYFGYLVEGSLTRVNPNPYNSINWVSQNASNAISYNEQITYFLDENHIWKTIDGGTNSIKDYKQSLVKIYPNPTTNFINIQTEKEIIQISILDLRGNEILKTQNTTINLQHFKKGIYFAKITMHNNTIVKRIIID